MGKVVKLSTPAKERRRRSRTALVLGGGGVTGGMYEIGALRALNLLSVNRTVNQFDVYVGTSAGAMIAALTANGVTPEQMMRVVNEEGGTPFPHVDLRTLLRPNYRRYAGRALQLPLHLASGLRALAGGVRSISAVDLVVALGDVLPSGLYTGAGLERYLRDVLTTDDFRRLPRELYLTATDLDTCERIVFGAPGWDDVPISAAVRASTALPMVYEPVNLKDRELVDGGIASTTNLDIAVEAGAKLVVVINPLVPFVDATSERRVSDRGFPRIGYQAFKLLAHQRLHETVRRYPDVDIVLIEPEPDDELMFETNVMNYRSRLQVMHHGLHSVATKLAADYDRLRAVAARHGIEVSAAKLQAHGTGVSAQPAIVKRPATAPSG